MDDILIRLKPEETLYQKNDPADALFIIKKGIIAMRLSNSQGFPVELAQLKQGQIIGDLAFFQPELRNCAAVALTDCELMSIPYKLVKKDFDCLKPWFKAMLSTLAGQVKDFARENRFLKSTTPQTQFTRDMEQLRYLSAVLHALNQYGQITNKQSVLIHLNDLYMVTIQIFGLLPNPIKPLLEALTQSTVARWQATEKPAMTLEVLKPMAIRTLCQFMIENINLRNFRFLRPSLSDIEALNCLLKYSESLTKTTSLSLKELLEYLQKSHSSLSSEAMLEFLHYLQLLDPSSETATISFNKTHLLELKQYWEVLFLLNYDDDPKLPNE